MYTTTLVGGSINNHTCVCLHIAYFKIKQIQVQNIQTSFFPSHDQIGVCVYLNATALSVVVTLFHKINIYNVN